jgi:hypothetical protein
MKKKTEKRTEADELRREYDLSKLKGGERRTGLFARIKFRKVSLHLGIYMPFL